jgi:hypothetical protein
MQEKSHGVNRGFFLDRTFDECQWNHRTGFRNITGNQGAIHVQQF